MHRRGAALLIAIAMLLCVLPLPAAHAAPRFSDIGPHYWAAGAIDALAASGIISGEPGGRFAPNQPVTRAQVTKMLVLARGLPVRTPAKPAFADVPPGNWAYPYVEAAYSAGVVHGVGGNRFDPNAPVSRQDLATMVARSAGLQAAGGAVPAPDYHDLRAIATYARAAVAVDAALGLVAGMPNGDFLPRAQSTRAQAATVTERLLTLPKARVTKLLVGAARTVVLVPQAASVALGGSDQIQARVLDAQGQPLDLKPTLSATGGTITANGVFKAAKPGIATITAQIGDAHGQVQVQVKDGAADLRLSPLPGSIAAGSSTVLHATTVDAAGNAVAADSGRTLTLTLDGPGGHQQLTATDQSGAVTFTLDVKTAGRYTLKAGGDGLQSTAPVTFTVTPGKASQLTLTAKPATLTRAGENAGIEAAVTDAYGNVLPTSAPITLQVSPADGGSLDASQSSIQGGRSLVADFHPTGLTKQVEISAAAPSLGLSGTATLQVKIAPVTVFTTGGALTATAGQAVTVQVALQGPNGQALTSDSGRELTLTVTGPTGKSSRLQQADNEGVAAFVVRETRAGTYKLQTGSQSRTLTVTPGPATALTLRTTPSFLVAPGQQASLRAAEVDRYGNQVPGRFPVTLALTGAAGRLTPAGSQATSGGVVATFLSYGHPGTATVTLSSPGSSLRPVQTTLQVVASPAALVSGKGMWVRYADVQRLGGAAIVRRAQSLGITHLYLWVGSTYDHDGFMGGPLLDSLLPPAHRAHIAVIAWIYDTLYNPGADLALARQAADHTAPGGDRADGLALDLETDATATPAIVGGFGQRLRSMLGPNYLLVAVTYPPQQRPDYPFATMARTMNVLAPMDYWHDQPQPFSPAQAAAFVTDSMTELRSATGDPNVPIAIIGQAYDMFDDGTYSPSGAEDTAALRAAASGGAVGFSLYYWGGATPAELQALGATPWR